MTKYEKAHQPCPHKGCGSSDAFTVYKDGSSHCFSCGKTEFATQTEVSAGVFAYITHRGISVETMKKFNVSAKITKDAVPFELFFPYNTDEGATVAYKVKQLQNKKFSVVDNQGQRGSEAFKNTHLFGKHLFEPGSAQTITITEGELDALSVYQMMGDYPVVSVKSASSAAADCKAEYDYLNAFDTIVLCFDNDEAGQEAVSAVAPLFDHSKLRIVRFEKAKDANDMLRTGRGSEFKKVWWSAKPYSPEFIISTFSDIENALNNDVHLESISFPFKRLDAMTYGMHIGEITLITALEGIGKTEVVRALEYHVLQESDYNIGVIHLEETQARTIKGFAGLHCQSPTHLPDSNFSTSEIMESYKAAVKRDGRVHLYTLHNTNNPELIKAAIRFLVTVAGCKYIFFDHITQLVAGSVDDERKVLDRLSVDLENMTKELEFGLILVSHVNDDLKTRGSRMVSKVASTSIHLDRDLEETDPIKRNTTHLIVRKNRVGAQTGPAGALFFDKDKFTITEIDDTSPPEQVFPAIPELKVG